MLAVLPFEGVEMLTATEVVLAKKVSFARILVATDFSTCSDRALEYALSMARRYDSRVYLTHIIDLDGYPRMAPEIAESSFVQLYRAAEKKFSDLNKSGRLAGIKHEEIIEPGGLWPEIKSLVDKYDISLVIAGTHGVGGVKNGAPGSGAEQIFRHVRVPTMTVGPAVTTEPLYETELKSILFATDFGPSAEREAAFAFTLAQQHCAKLTMLNVVPYVRDCSLEAMARMRNEVTQKLAALVPTVAELKCKCEFLMVVGEPVEEILRWARKTDADLMVMGAQKSEALADTYPHTKAYRIVHGASCPVITIRS